MAEPKQLSELRAELETETEGTRRESLGLPQLIFMAIDRINKINVLTGLMGTIRSKYILAKTFEKSVSTLESMLNPYLDKKYFEEVKDLRKRERESTQEGAADHIKTIIALEDFRFCCLMDLMHRKNLLLQGNTSEAT